MCLLVLSLNAFGKNFHKLKFVSKRVNSVKDHLTTLVYIPLKTKRNFVLYDNIIFFLVVPVIGDMTSIND